jgi:hypothetical protein
VCDVAESCNGASNDCPDDGFKSASTTCRASAGACDLAESCTGSSAACPSDAKSTAECRASAGVCDVAESCNGAHNDCPADGFQSSATVCRAGSGDLCDPSESCTGFGPTCPADVVKPSSYVCRAAAGDCDVAESCTGSALATCPANGFKTAGSSCGSSTDTECNDPDSCDGAGTCLANNAAAGTPCGDAAAQCVNQDTCTGSGGCTDNGFKSSSTACNDGNACTQTDFCSGNSSSCLGANYAWSGVLQPINADGTSIFKLGSTVPTKFKLTGLCTGVGTLTYKIFLAKITNSELGSEVEASSTSGADIGNTFRYDATEGQYIFNLNTKSLSPGTWQIRIAQYAGSSELGTLGTVNVSLRK